MVVVGREPRDHQGVQKKGRETQMVEPLPAVRTLLKTVCTPAGGRAKDHMWDPSVYSSCMITS